MKKLFLIVTLFSIFSAIGQTVAEINKSANISDTLLNNNEIRIYKKYKSSEKANLLRFYCILGDKWEAQIFSYSRKFNTITKIEVLEFPKTKLGNLEPKNAYLIWLNILLCDVEHLPSLKNINYKLKSNSIDLEDGTYRIIEKRNDFLNGNTYEVFVKNGVNENYFSFNDSENYLKNFPNVDEIISYNNLLKIIRKEFNPWDE